MRNAVFPRENVVLDACCVISLYASGYMEPILEALPVQAVIAKYVHEVEATRIYCGPPEYVKKEAQSINLQRLIDSELIKIVFLEDEIEKITVTNFSCSMLDDGEAISAAIALHRHWSFGTDDRMAMAHFKRHVPQLHLISTLDMVKNWADTTNATSFTVSTALQNIYHRGRYKPRDKHPLYRWWKQFFHTHEI